MFLSLIGCTNMLHYTDRKDEIQSAQFIRLLVHYEHCQLYGMRNISLISNLSSHFLCFFSYNYCYWGSSHRGNDNGNGDMWSKQVDLILMPYSSLCKQPCQTLPVSSNLYFSLFLFLPRYNSDCSHIPL